MEKSRINKYYLGIFNDEENVVKIDNFFMFLKNNQDKTFDEKTNLFICSGNKQQALSFATNTARYIKEENIGGACKIVSFEELYLLIYDLLLKHFQCHPHLLKP